jgi:hypothetical protein
MTCSSFVEMILCSVLTGNVTVSYYCIPMCEFSMMNLYLSYRITQSAYIPLNELLQCPLLMLKLFWPAEQILSDMRATGCE